MLRERLAVLRAVLAGTPGETHDDAVQRITTLTIVAACVTSSLVGVAIVVLLLTLVLPLPVDPFASRTALRNFVAIAIYVPFALLVGVRVGRRIGDGATVWMREGRAPTARERRRVVAMPIRLFSMQLGLWALAAVIFGGLNLTVDALWAFEVGITVLLAGVATAAVASLLAVRFGRSIVARALEDAAPQRYRIVPGVAVRSVFGWALGSAVPITGALVLCAVALGQEDVGRVELARSVVALSAIALVIGLLAIVLTARSIADPLAQLRDALGRVEQGDLDVSVPVNDASEVGFLQAGFNRMVGGLRERERVRDLFGRHVGHDVAQRAMEEGVRLGGEERQAAALFVDLVGSTTLASDRSPTEVVTILNAFFAVVVEVTRAHGGLVNKFEGDGALCVFGAPLAHDDPAGAALGAAREMQDRLVAEVDGVRAAIGVSYGTVVAGNVGAADRFEYTVIGDPVNEAARLTELAKEQPRLIAASERALEAAGAADERALWALGDAVVLRGRSAPTRLATPA
ncbi:HAMP domain-containing protein [Conexibacter sp. W3-3-2]|uniref:adenylate/guanylate cyclase domain-containing protein n=1 Tax=Conexibacter sp. W3-3-2 TaxID=2675227 RepID=UPI0012B99ABA|nr:adenylate/guanylate cyclase domain-containing protein [Conexibacter sp. W3-3-2]MTD44074.1 HAMP domain-containing protein [Conexibacter sp. W3-3-2]